MKKEKNTKDSKKELLEPKPKTMTLDMRKWYCRGIKTIQSGPRSSGVHKS